MYLVEYSQHDRPLWMVTDDPLKSYINPLHLVLIQNENLTTAYVRRLHPGRKSDYVNNDLLP